MSEKNDPKETVKISRKELEDLKNAELVEISREELEELKEKAGDRYAHGDTWPGSQSPGTGTGA